MGIIEFMDNIDLASGAKDVVLSVYMDESQYLEYKEQFYLDSLSFFEKIKACANYRQLFLYLYVRLGHDCLAEYKDKGICEQIYFDTFHNLAVTSENCFREFGEYGIDGYSWASKFPKLMIFALGRLQFELLPTSYAFTVSGRKIYKDEIIINVHIPRGEPLGIEECKKSLCLAKNFFRGVSNVFYCFSWLLSKEIEEILGEDSNIVKFQKMFTIIGESENFGGGKWFIFNTYETDVSKYSENTFLQRQVKQKMLEGKDFHARTGIYLA